MLKEIVRQDYVRISRMLLEKLRLLECSLHGYRRNDREWLELLLHPEFREITRSGVMVDRSETITSLLSENTALPIISSDFRLTEMAEGCVMLHYRTSYADGSRPAYVPHAGCVQRKDSGLWFFTRERQQHVVPRFVTGMLWSIDQVLPTLFSNW